MPLASRLAFGKKAGGGNEQKAKSMGSDDWLLVTLVEGNVAGWRGPGGEAGRVGWGRISVCVKRGVLR